MGSRKKESGLQLAKSTKSDCVTQTFKSGISQHDYVIHSRMQSHASLSYCREPELLRIEACNNGGGYIIGHYYENIGKKLC